MDPPLVKVSTEINVSMQSGLVKDEDIRLDFADLTLKSLKDHACSFIDRNFPNHGLNRLSERLLLFRHDYSSENVLLPVNVVSDVTDGCLLEIVLSANPPSEVVQIRPHSLLIHSYKSPAFCDFCGEMLFGLFHQGLKCDSCGLNYHKRCVYKIPNNCSHGRRRRSSTYLLPIVSNTANADQQDRTGIQRTNSSGSLINDLKTISISSSPVRSRQLSQSTLSSTNSNISGRPAWVEKELAERIRVPHTFVVHSYTRPTMCQHCKKLLKGLFRQGFQCKDCKFNAHKKCMEKLPWGCAGEAPKGFLESNEDEVETERELDPDGNIVFKGDDINRGLPLDTNVGEEECRDDMASSINIPLMRIVQSVKNVKRRESKVLKEGWVTHYTNKDATKRKHFWRLDTKAITMFQSDSSSKYYKEIPLPEILNIVSHKSGNTKKEVYLFEIRTKNVTYFIGEDSSTANTWEKHLRQALMPVPSTSDPVTDKNGKPVNSSNSVNHVPQEYPEEEEEQNDDLSHQYQIFIDQVLGAGQFGTVFSGVHRTSHRDVAIKVINKLRFPTKQEAQLKNEVSILQNISHPGVVNLEKMYETPENIFVVMERLSGDMLDMILTSEGSKLSEGVTKFLIYQILVALRYLHSQNICHCDLKPENVLLSSNCEYPQVKLCDFGFARIIGEKSFRRSVVGTPAYLAPEVLRDKKYNKSLDMWSVGVIIYVSLSGTFPFNEEEDIKDQIKSASFMYPEDVWNPISSIAINLIGCLLQVESRTRFTVDKCLGHAWLNDYNVWVDLRKLEKRLKIRWLTHESDDRRWEDYRVKHNLPAIDLMDGSKGDNGTESNHRHSNLNNGHDTATNSGYHPQSTMNGSSRL